MEEEGKKSDLLKNDFLDLDEGTFKIKKKVKVQENLQDHHTLLGDSSFNFGLLNVKHVKVDEMNVIKVYNDIIEESSVDDRYFQTIKSIISVANKSLVSFLLLGLISRSRKTNSSRKNGSTSNPQTT